MGRDRSRSDQGGEPRPLHAANLATRERLRQEQIKRGQRPWNETAIQAIIDRCAAL
jgi:hypothetical protein